MKKSVISTAIALAMGAGTADAADMSSATFIMYDDTGTLVSNTCGGSGNCPNGVDPTLTGTIGNGVWSVASSETFFGQNWFAKSGTTFGPGTYTFDVRKNETPNPLYTGIIVGPNQVGGHILFDWGAVNTLTNCGVAACNIDVVNVWNLNTVGGITNYTSTDVVGNRKTGGGVVTVLGPNGTPGLPMIDGGFLGFMANFEFVTGQAAGAPVAGDFTIFTDAVSDVTGIDMLANANDGGIPGTDLSLDACSSPSTEGGTVTTNLDDTCDYSPPPGLAVDDTFTYTVFDGVLTSTPGTVTVDIDNQPPTCNDLSLATGLNVSLDIPQSTITDECTDPDGEEPLSVDSYTQPANGQVNGNDPLVYTPNAGFLGVDTFNVTVTDTRGGVSVSAVQVDVTDKPFGNFTMIDPAGGTFGGTNDILADWDGTFNTAVTDTNFNMDIASASSFPFFGFPWFAHDIRVFGPGNYAFDTTCSLAQVQAGAADCGGLPAQFLQLNVGAGQTGAHILFDWNVTENIDVVLLWDEDGIFTNPDPAGAIYLGPAGPTPDATCAYQFVSRDADGDTVPGARMIDGPFIGFRANFNVNFTRPCLAGELVVEKSKVKSPDTGGCTISSSIISPFKRIDQLLILGFTAWLGLQLRRRKNT